MTVYCSFCGKSQHEVVTLIAGPSDGHRTPFICDECVDLCIEICSDARQRARINKHLADVIRNGT